MRISDWSSDVCSSDLAAEPPLPDLARRAGIDRAQHAGLLWSVLGTISAGGRHRPVAARRDRGVSARGVPLVVRRDAGAAGGKPRLVLRARRHPCTGDRAVSRDVKTEAFAMASFVLLVNTLRDRERVVEGKSVSVR